MNELVFLLWASDMVESLKFACFLIAVVSSLGSAFVGLLMHSENQVLSFRGILGNCWWLIIPLAFLILLPSRTTMQAFVAARTGEYMLATPLGDKSVKALNSVLDRVIAESASKDKK